MCFLQPLAIWDFSGAFNFSNFWVLFMGVAILNFKVVPGGSHGYFFEVKVETVKLIGGK